MIPKAECQQRRVLFVCSGNTCRSPMAAALASWLWPGRVRAQSSGITVDSDGAAPEAVDVMRENFSVDISGHRPTDVRSVSLDQVDKVVAMDENVGHWLERTPGIPARKLIELAVPDPWGGSVEHYAQMAEKICQLLRERQAEILQG